MGESDSLDMLLFALLSFYAYLIQGSTPHKKIMLKLLRHGIVFFVEYCWGHTLMLHLMLPEWTMLDILLKYYLKCDILFQETTDCATSFSATGIRSEGVSPEL